jgi:hypothetical protein
MKKLSLSLTLLLICGAAACSSTDNKPDGGGSNPNAIIPTADGFVDGTNDWGILGAWYSYADSYKMGATGDCQAAGFTAADCSTVETPVLGQPFTNVGGKMCTKGTAAKTIPAPGMSSPAYAAIWGAGIGLDFNNAGNDGGTGKLAFNADAAGVKGFSFDIDKLPALGGQMRVEFPATSQSGNDAAYWGGANANLSPLVVGTNTIRWAMVGGPMYLAMPPAFDPTKITGIQFHVVANTSAAVPYEFCISNLAPITN